MNLEVHVYTTPLILHITHSTIINFITQGVMHLTLLREVTLSVFSWRDNPRRINNVLHIHVYNIVLMYMYSRHQKKLPVLQNGTDSLGVENGKRTDTKRIAHGYRKERPVPFCFPFRSVYFLFARSIPFHCVPFRSPRVRRYS